MRWHFLVLAVATLIVIDGHPLYRSEEEQDEDVATSNEKIGDKKEEIQDIQEEEDDSADTKSNIASKSVSIDEKKDDIEESDKTEKKDDTEGSGNIEKKDDTEESDKPEKKDDTKSDKIEKKDDTKSDKIEKKDDTEESNKIEKKDDTEESDKTEKKDDTKESDKPVIKSVSEAKHDEPHNVKEEETQVPKEASKKTKVKKKGKKKQGQDEVNAEAKETIAPSKEPAAKKSSAEKKDNSKKWWMVGDHPHWGGRGHGHWGPPHHSESSYGGGGGGGGYEGHGGNRRSHKSHVAKCCKHKDKNVRKRCECGHHEDAHHLEGYHFHEHGHGGHNDHDHDLKGPWAFGFDGFGDDWNDWDHNNHNFEHLQQLEHDSHQGHHEDGCHGEGYSKKDCVELNPGTIPGIPVGPPTSEAVGPAVVGPAGPPVLETGPGTVIGPAPAPFLQAGPEPVVGPAAGPILGPGAGPILGPGAGPILGPAIGPILGPAAGPVIGPDVGPILGAGQIIAPMAAPMAAQAPFGVPPVSLFPLPPPAVPQPPYRMCHDCHTLKNGGSRCLCKTMKHPHEASTDYDHHVYIDCDATTHNYPADNQLCYSRAGIPTPELEKTTDPRPKKQGVVYPYVGYGPWSAYPWWGDWWGGHGNHGWGGENGGCAHPCENEKHGCGECQHQQPHTQALPEHGDHSVDVQHGQSIVNHEHEPAHSDCPTSCPGVGAGHEVGFSLGGAAQGAANLHTYRCHDVIENKVDDTSTRSKRFCVPVGYHGGYGWPYWHGYPGVGTGLWGWGWPWIKNKVPGSKGKDESNKTATAGEKEAIKTPPIRRSYIDGNSNKNIKKKQTIHVGYGYASGDNYRLGYGYGGMGGVAGFAPGANAIGESSSQSPFSRSKIETEEARNTLTYEKNNIPKPEKEITVTGTKRDIEKGDNNADNSMANA